MRLVQSFVMLFLFVSCVNEDYTLKEYLGHPVKFDKQKVDYPNNDFSMLIPNDWEWEIEEVNHEKVLLKMDIYRKVIAEGAIDLISVEKMKSFGDNKSLKSEYEHFLKLIKNKFKGAKIVELGYTEVLEHPSYFIHVKSVSGQVGKAEFISFIMRSDTKNIFYYLTASASQVNGLKKNMSVMLKSLQTFKLVGGKKKETI